MCTMYNKYIHTNSNKGSAEGLIKITILKHEQIFSNDMNT